MNIDQRWSDCDRYSNYIYSQQSTVLHLYTYPWEIITNEIDFRTINPSQNSKDERTGAVETSQHPATGN
ncbi:hypothetical protein H6G36_20725 [Anabaena minutissima FACHB-250]|nr:hypothetical protein [Anabaena minutissima FACHB-250]